ncbi:hypothetical protein METP3_00913 [Methanosarcinales archaeon]|nr:hypothetical protein METP3_00913 [Methanosarcinales archaeon]
MLKKGLFFAAAASLSLFLFSPTEACDTSSCPISHRKIHQAPWEQLVEKSFGLPAGFGKALMTETEWIEEKVLMGGMSAQEREEYKRKKNSELIRKADDLGIMIPAIGKKRVFEMQKIMPINYKGTADSQ